MVTSLRRIQNRVDADVVKLQNENQVYKCTCELPHDLLAAIKQATLLENGKPKGKKKAKYFAADMSDLAGAMDRIQALEEQNEHLMLDN